MNTYTVKVERTIYAETEAEARAYVEQWRRSDPRIAIVSPITLTHDGHGPYEYGIRVRMTNTLRPMGDHVAPWGQDRDGAVERITTMGGNNVTLVRRPLGNANHDWEVAP